MLRVENLEKHFGQRELWRAISFSVEPREMVAITGPSGCGKTTLLNCIGLLEKVDGGSILLDGNELCRVSARARRKFWRERLGFLFQDYGLVESISVERNVRIVEPHLRVVSKLRSKAALALESVGLGGRGKEPTFQFSGGEQQRVALARIILKQPSLVLADEPTGSLDANNELMVLSHLRNIAEQGTMVLIATHSARVIEMCDRVVRLGPSPGESG